MSELKPMPVVSEDPEIQLRYERMRIEGLSHNLAEMFVLQTPPQLGMTDAVFNEGRCNGNQFEGSEAIGNAYAAEARALGINLKGKHYQHGLAKYPGDPEAWVSGRSEAEAVIRKNGWGATGAVNVEAVEPIAPPKDVPVADDLVEDQVISALEKIPEAKRPLVDLDDLRGQIREEMTPYYAKE